MSNASKKKNVFALLVGGIDLELLRELIDAEVAVSAVEIGAGDEREAEVCRGVVHHPSNDGVLAGGEDHRLPERALVDRTDDGVRGLKDSAGEDVHGLRRLTRDLVVYESVEEVALRVDPQI